MDKKNIKNIHMWPYNTSSNVLSEKVIQVFKNGMKECSKDNIDSILVRHLANRKTPQVSTDYFSVEMPINRFGLYIP